jgi:hypothetical protein
MDYIRRQVEENRVLEDNVVCSVMVIKYCSLTPDGGP